MQTNVFYQSGALTPEEYTAWYNRHAAAQGKRCALIMAGGHSSRMGQDKPTVALNGKSMLERAVAFWRSVPFIDRILIAVGPAGHLTDVIPEGCTPIPDLIADRGPLAGIQAALRMTDAQLLWVSAVDLPFLTVDRVLPEPQGDAIVYCNGNRPEPLFGVYRRSVLPVVERLLMDGVGKMRAMLDAVDTQYIPLSSADGAFLRNVNTPEELLRAQVGSPPLIPVVAWSGTGKTTALEGLIPALRRRGVRVCVIKHDAHTFEVDKPGKDTYRFTAAGATAAAIMNPQKWAIMGQGECTLDVLRDRLPECDLIFAEGFKYTNRPRIEIHRRATNRPLISDPETLIAVMTDEALDIAAPQIALNDYEKCADLLCRLFLEDN